MCIVLEIAHYVLTSSGSLTNWGKAGKGETEVSMMKLMMEEWGEIKWSKTIGGCYRACPEGH